MTLSNLTVKAKLTAAFGVLATLVVGISLLALNLLSDAHRQFASYVGETQRRGDLALAVRAGANARAISARNLVLVTKPEDLASEKATVQAAHDSVKSNLAKLKDAVAKDAGVSDKERTALAEIEKIESSYGPLALNIVGLAVGGQRDQAVEKINAECRPLLSALLKSASTYAATIDEQGAAQTKAAEASHASNQMVLAGFSLATLIAAMALTVVITRGLSHALGAEPGDLGAAAARVASGDLSTVPGAAAAPAGSVLSVLGTMQASLANLVGQVRNASDSIATGAAQIASGNADLSQRTEQQAANLEETAASMEEMNATVRNNADTARQATQLATSASAVAEKGGQVVAQVVTTMDEITASSKRIGDIIGVIDGIAFQTNILALNAAVEAARAGEQGRGFAVVAGEVRSLAQRSAEAAREIKGLISTSVEKVDAGSRLVGEAGTTINEVVTQARRVADLIGEISSATIEQTSGISQVSQAVTMLDQATQQNAALVEQSAAAADSLRQQAFAMTEVVKTFTIGDGQAGHGAHTGAPAIASTVVKAASAYKAKPAAARVTPAPKPVAAPAAPTPKAEPAAASSDDWETF